MDDEIARLRGQLKVMTIALTNLAGGGSEVFTRIGSGDDEMFIADVNVCEQRIREKFYAAHRLAQAVVRRRGYSLETCKEIWNDKTGEHFEIGPDRDGLDLIEIRFVDSQGQICDRLSFTKDAAGLLCDALAELLP